MLKPPYILMKDNFNVLRIWAQDEDGEPQSIGSASSDGGTTPEEDKEHGEFIALACNAHANLITLIENLLPALDPEIAQNTREMLFTVLEKSKVSTLERPRIKNLEEDI